MSRQQLLCNDVRGCWSRVCSALVCGACVQRARVQRVQRVSSVLVIASVRMMGVCMCAGMMVCRMCAVRLCCVMVVWASTRAMVRFCAVCSSGASRGRMRTFWCELHVEKKCVALHVHLQHVVVVDGHGGDRAWPRNLLRAVCLGDVGHLGPADHLRRGRWAAGAEVTRVPTGRTTATTSAPGK